jgi:6-phosphogluconolactonase (cycloisomerase 2 family)
LSFSINPNTGALTKLPGTPTLFAEGTGSLTLDRTAKLLYASIGSGIHGYRIAWNGQLIPLPGSPYNVAGGLLAVDPFNRFLYASGSKIAVYRIEPNGSLRAVPGSPFATGGQIATDPFGRFIYVIDLHKGIAVYNVLASGALTPVPGSPFTALVTNYAYAGYPADDLIKVVADPTGRFVYTASEYLFNIMSFRVNSNGALTQIGSLSIGGAWNENMTIDPFGHYLYMDEGTSELGVYNINPTTGIPVAGQDVFVGDAASGGQLDNNPVGVRVSPNAKFVYVGNANGVVDPGPMTIHGFQVGPTGNLTLVPGSPYYPLGNTLDPAKVVATEGYPSSMVVAP